MGHITLQAKRINHGQSEIWLESDGKVASQKRTLATNEVVYVARHHCPAETFDAFYRDYQVTLGNVASLSADSIDDIAAELKLSA